MRQIRHATTSLLVGIVLTMPAAASECTADLDGSGDVGFSDLLAVLTAWGPCPGCPEDLDGDDSVGFGDLLELLAAWGPCPFETAELGGNPLDAYPHFEFVRAFNEGEGVSFAIDPTRFPRIVEQSGFAYIVAAKTAEQWHADRGLVDVRGAPQAVSFVAGGIEDNRIALTDSDTLSGDAGIDLGVGYDLVLDLDSDGHLSAGDFIDGYGDEAGFYVVRDPSQPGPLEIAAVSYLVEDVPAGFAQQRALYPASISEMGQLPLVLVGTSGGTQHTWYDHIGKHLGSYGYIVVVHPNNDGPGVSTIVTTILAHTEAVIAQQAEIAGGALDGHIDSSRIMWVGEGRAGEGIAVAYHRIVTGEYAPRHFTQESIRLISSIGPTDFLATGNPHDAAYHLIWGSADGDVSGSPGCGICQSFHLPERGEGFRHVNYVHGMDHNDLNCCGFNDFTGPPGTEIGRTEAQLIGRAIWLALVKRHMEGSVPALDYVTRQWERFRPPGVLQTSTVDHEYHEPGTAGHFVIDDFQSNELLTVSSSGGDVGFSVDNLVEGLLDDNNTSFTWIESDPMNGMTRALGTDSTRGIVFDYDEPSHLEFEIIDGERDFTAHTFLSFRACQGTRHPLTVAALEDLTITVTLRDGDGDESSINIGAYGGGIEEPYQRTSSGIGAGWQNEFDTIRIRLTDFTHDAPDFDLSDIHAVRFDFGAPHGSKVGRLGLDDVELCGVVR